MELTHRFTVPTGVEETWAHFANIAEVAECFPGATVNDVDESGTFHGSCKVKLGPIALVYNGSGTFVEKDDAAHRFVVDAHGKDKRGNGTAGAKVTLTMAGDGDSTDVEVLTDLAITGKPAQFGRGVMQDVSDKLLGQFVACLETRLAGGTDETPGESGRPGAAPVEGAAAPAGPEEAAEPVEPAAGLAPVTPVAPPVPAAESRSAGGSRAARTAAPPQDDALDLGATVLPILAKTYWKQAAAVVAVVALIIWWVTRD